ncbi:MAG: cytochrome [Acidimicrobiia bacterium]
MQISPSPPLAPFALPWDDPDVTDPVSTLTQARADLGDTFEVASGRDRYLFVFSPDALRAFYALPERDASKGLADYRMLARKLPQELFAGVRTLAHDLFGAQEVETYLGHLDYALDLEIAALGAEGTIDAFGFARRVGHRLGLACWVGDRAAGPPWFGRLVAELDLLDAADAFVHPARMRAVKSADKHIEREALARFEAAVGALLADADGGPGRTGFLDEIARRWSDTEEPARTQGIARDVVLLHVATMTNLFAALGWTLAQLTLEPDILARVVAGDGPLLERCALESTRIGQCSLMSRTVMTDLEFDDGTTRYRLSRGVTLATMLALTNTSAAPGLDRYDPDRWEGQRLRDEASLPTREAVTTFGYGPHRCPARRFSLSAITRTVRRLCTTYDLDAQFTSLRPIAEQIGGVARAADPCPIGYRARVTNG